MKLERKVYDTVKNLKVGDKPKVIKTHFRDCIVTPKMVGGHIGIYNGKEYKEVEVKLDMIGRYLGEYSLTYKPTLRKAANIINDKKKAIADA